MTAEAPRRSLPSLSMNRRTLAPTLVLVSLVAWLLLSWFQTGRRVLNDDLAFPVADYWRIIQVYERYLRFDLGVLWVQHNEHRIIFPELVYAADAMLFHGRQLLPLVVSCLCYLASWVVLAWVFGSSSKENAFRCAVPILLAGIILGSPSSSLVLGSPFLLQWTLQQLAVSLTFYWLSRLAENPQWKWLAGVICGAAVTLYSSGNGLMLWPLLLAGAVVLKVRRVDLMRLGAAAVVSTRLYFAGYQFTNALAPAKIIQHPLYAAGFIASYLGLPWSAAMSVRVGIFLGVLNIVAFSVLAGIVTRHRLWRMRAPVVYFGFYLFTLATGSIITSGRMDPTDPAFSTALAPRYVTFPLTNWAVLLLAACWLSLKLGWRVPSWQQLSTLAVLFLLFSRRGVERWVERSERPIMDQSAAALSIECGLLDPGWIQTFFPDTAFIAVYVPVMQKYHLSVFSQAPYTWLGQKVSVVFPRISQQRDAGAITQMKPVKGGIQVVGWVDTQRSEKNIVLVSDADQIVGLGRRPLPGFPPELMSVDTPSLLGWIGFINRSFPVKSYRAFLIHNRRSGAELTPVSGTIVLND